MSRKRDGSISKHNIENLRENERHVTCLEKVEQGLIFSRSGKSITKMDEYLKPKSYYL